MDINEDAINPIVNFLHKLLGNNLWILPASLAITGWIMWLLIGSDLYLVIAILCSSTFVLYICSLIYSWLQYVLMSYKKKNISKKTRELQEKQKQLDVRNQAQNHASRIWKLVAHTNIDYIKRAAIILDFGIHDNEECLRYIEIPRNADYEWHSGLSDLLKIASHFEYNLSYGNRIKLIDITQQKDVVYIQIEAYFYKLLKHFAATGNWVKL